MYAPNSVFGRGRPGRPASVADVTLILKKALPNVEASR